MKSSQPDEINRQDFYRTVYAMQDDGPDRLIDISQESNPVIAIDCCGWHYAHVFEKPVIMLEMLSTAKTFRLLPRHFHKLIDDRANLLAWPLMLDIKDPVVILDRSPVLKYRSLAQLADILAEIGRWYHPSKIVCRGQLQFVDDSRMADRLPSWFEVLHIPGYVVSKFHYDTDIMSYGINLRKIT